MNSTAKELLENKDWLYERYVVQQYSANRIAKELGVVAPTVIKYIERYGWELRPAGLSKTLTSLQIGPKNKKLADRDWLYDKYITQKMALRDIAALAGRGSRRGIVRALAFHKIPIRDLKDARINRASKGPEFRSTIKPEANDLEYIRQLYDSGLSISSICDELGISVEAVRHRFKAANIKCRNPWEHWIGATHSDETKIKMSAVATQQIIDGERNTHTGTILMCNTLHQGYRKVRSAWEKSYINWLTKNGVDYYYERDTFKLSSGASYVPDFYLPNTDEYIEIKGYLDEGHRQKYSLFQKEYPHLKWSIYMRDDLSRLGIDTRHKYKTVYLLCGAAGSGKSWVANQLLDKFHYVSFDGVRKKDHIDTIRAQPDDKPVLFDPNIKISTLIKRHSDEFNIIPVFIIESEEVVKERIAKRGGEWTEHIPKRMKVMEARNAKYGVFSGTAEEVLQWLKEQA